MKRWFFTKVTAWLIAGGLITGVFIAFPPFHIVSLEENRSRINEGVFDPLVFARQFWQNELPAAFKNASDAQEVLSAIRDNPDQAKARYGRIVGLGGPCYFFLKGSGTITAIDPRQIKVRLEGRDSNAEIILMTSMIFGNEVLDATNIITRNQFKKTNDYNAISAEINKMVQTQLADPFRKQAKTGETIHFIGCSTSIMDEDLALPMRLVPVKLEAVQ